MCGAAQYVSHVCHVCGRRGWEHAARLEHGLHGTACCHIRNACMACTTLLSASHAHRACCINRASVIITAAQVLGHQSWIIIAIIEPLIDDQPGDHLRLVNGPRPSGLSKPTATSTALAPFPAARLCTPLIWVTATRTCTLTHPEAARQSTCALCAATPVCAGRCPRQPSQAPRPQLPTGRQRRLRMMLPCTQMRAFTGRRGACARQSAGRRAVRVQAVAAPPQPKYQRPDPTGRYGVYGGKYVPETLIPALEDLEVQYKAAAQDPAFKVR